MPTAIRTTLCALCAACLPLGDGSAHASSERAMGSSTLPSGDLLALTASAQYFSTRLIQDATSVSDLRQGSIYRVSAEIACATSSSPGTITINVSHLDGSTATVFGSVTFTPPASTTGLRIALEGEFTYTVTQTLAVNPSQIAYDIGTAYGHVLVAGASTPYFFAPSGLTSQVSGTTGWASGFATANSTANAVAVGMLSSGAGNTCDAMVLINRVV